MNGPTLRCRSCGAENRSDAIYCTMCGSELNTPGLDTKGRILFFSTPFVFLLLGIALAYDLGFPDPIEAGATIGLSFLSLVYLIVAGTTWILCRSFGILFKPTMPWRAGLFGIFQLIASIILSIPLQEYLITDRVLSITLKDEERLKIGLVFALFLPLVLFGLCLLVLSDHFTLTKKAEEDKEIAESRNDSKYLLTKIGRFGSLPVFFGTLLASVLLLMALPTHKREFLYARIAAGLQMVDPALANLNKALAESPQFAPALHLRGFLRVTGIDRGQAQDGIRDLQEAVKLAPNNARYHLDLAICLDHLGRTREAVEIASQAIKLRPFEPALWVALADFRLKLQDKEGAVAAYREALKLDPDDPRTLNNLAYTLLELDRELPWALELAKASVAKMPNHIFNLDTLAWALYKNDQVGEAYQIMLQIKEGVSTLSAEIAFHDAAISHKMGLLTNPRQTFESLWQRSDVQADPSLRQEITSFIASLGINIKKFGEDVGSTATSIATQAENPVNFRPTPLSSQTVIQASSTATSNASDSSNQTNQRPHTGNSSANLTNNTEGMQTEDDP